MWGDNNRQEEEIDLWADPIIVDNLWDNFDPFGQEDIEEVEMGRLDSETQPASQGPTLRDIIIEDAPTVMDEIPTVIDELPDVIDEPLVDEN